MFRRLRTVERVGLLGGEDAQVDPLAGLEVQVTGGGLVEGHLERLGQIGQPTAHHRRAFDLEFAGDAERFSAER